MVKKRSDTNVNEDKSIDPFFKSALEQSDLPYVVYKVNGDAYEFVLVSKGLVQLYPVLKEDLDSLSISSLRKRIHLDDLDKYTKDFDEFAANKDEVLDCYFRELDNEDKINVVHAKGQHLQVQNEDYLIISCTPAGEMEDDEVELNDDYLNKIPSFHEYVERDELTSFLNMSGFLRKAQNIISHDERRYAIIALDLTGMKSFNIKYGFAKGNELIINTGKILKKNFPDATLSRFGEDHFYILTLDRDIEKKLEDSFSDMKDLGEGNSLPIRAGIFNGEFDDIAKACDKAKTASDVKRHSYFSQFNYFTQDLMAKIEKQDYILNHLDEAIENGNIMPYYQPIVRTVNGKVCDEEALARWKDEYYGFLSPADFIPILENSRLIYKLDLCILKRVLEDFKKKDKLNLGNSSVSINISRYDFESCDIVKEVETLVNESGYPKSMIRIEITESAVVNDKESLKEQIHRFHQAGFKVWMDDFGSGYSSLNSLQDFEFDGMKIDMGFLHSFKSNSKTQDIIRESIKIAEKLGIDTICEGVEEEEQLSFLRDAGCDKVQGYLFSYPRPLSDIIERKCVIGRENLEEDDYYLTVGTLSLDDMGNNGDKGTIAEKALLGPRTGIIEISNGELYLTRGTSYFIETCSRRGFIKEDGREKKGWKFIREPDPEFMRMIQTCISSGNWEEISFQEKDSVSTFLFRKIAVNPISGATSVIAILTKTKKHKISSHGGYVDSSETSPVFEIKDIHIPTAIVNVFENEYGDDDFRLIKANHELHTLIGIPEKSVQNNATYCQVVNNPDKEWIKLFKQCLKTNGTIEGEKYGELSGCLLHYIISPSGSPNCVSVSISKVSFSKELATSNNETKTIADEAYRISTIFKLNEEYSTRMEHVLSELGDVLKSDNLLILETSDGNLKNKFEWCKEGFSSISTTIPEHNFDFANFDYEGFFVSHDVYIQNDIEEANEKNPSLYNWCRNRGVKRFIIYPIRNKHEIIGLLIANNYSLDKLDFTKALLSKVLGLLSTDIRLHSEKAAINIEKENSKRGFKGFLRRLNLKRFLGFEKTTVSEKQYIDRENMYLARITAVFMTIFELIFMVSFIIFVDNQKSLGNNNFYTTPYWSIIHLSLYGFFLVVNILFLIYSQLYLMGKLNKWKNLTQKTNLVVEIYVICCNLFGVIVSTMDYQTNEQSIVFMMMILYTFLVYRLHPVKSTIYLVVIYSLYFFLIAHIPTVIFPDGVQTFNDTENTTEVLRMDANVAFMGNMLALLLLEIIICFVLYNSRMNAANYCLIDRLSKCKNRFSLEEDYKHLFNRPLVMMMMDVDDFKLVNDVNGHQAGDLVLEEVGKALRETFDPECVYRYGGDEFLIIKKGDKFSFEKHLALLQENIDKNVSIDMRITFSAGYKSVEISDKISLEKSIREADLLLYEAKKHGKNKIIAE